MTESDRIWIREQADKVRATGQVKPIRFTTQSPQFCEAAAEWDHTWRVIEVDADGVETVECTECKVRA